MSTPAALRLQRQAAAVIERIAIGRLLNDRLVGVVETRLANFFATRMAMGALRRSDPGRAAQLTIALCLGLDPRRLFRPAEAAGILPRARSQFLLAVLHYLYTHRKFPANEAEDDTKK